MTSRRCTAQHPCVLVDCLAKTVGQVCVCVWTICPKLLRPVDESETGRSQVARPDHNTITPQVAQMSPNTCRPRAVGLSRARRRTFQDVTYEQWFPSWSQRVADRFRRVRMRIRTVYTVLIKYWSAELRARTDGGRRRCRAIAGKQRRQSATRSAEQSGHSALPRPPPSATATAERGTDAALFGQ